MAVVDSSLEPRRLLDLALRTVLETLGPDLHGAILLLTREGRRLEVAVQQGLMPEGTSFEIALGEDACSRVAREGTPVFEAVCSCQECGIGAWIKARHGHLVFPLRARQKVIGVFCVVYPPNFNLDVTDLSLWEDVGSQIGLAVDNANLYAQVQQERDFLETLYNISEQLASSLDLDWVLSQVLQLSITATDARDGSIFLLPGTDAPGMSILRRDLSALEASQAIDTVLKRGMAGWVVRHKIGAVIDNTSLDSRWLSFVDDPNPPGSALAVPLIAEDQVVGVLTLDHPQTGHFSYRHLVLMSAIAHQASTAIERARLYKEIAHMAEVLEQRVEERTRELREMQNQLIHAEKLAALGELAAGVAHEIGNPLQILQTYVEYMTAHAEADAFLLEFADPLRDSLEAIGRLVAQLRDFSRPALGERKPVDVCAVVSNILRLAGKELAHSGIQVEERRSVHSPLVIGDRRQLEQVFLNLILNARDAMPGGGRLTIETVTNDGQVSIRFCDTGVGISAEDLPRILEPYYTTKKDRGTGLGLAICQRIVSQHQGQINIASELGKGATFTVSLPLAPDDLD
jgi:signal transduction histidine kinase